MYINLKLSKILFGGVRKWILLCYELSPTPKVLIESEEIKKLKCMEIEEVPLHSPNFSLKK